MLLPVLPNESNLRARSDASKPPEISGRPPADFSRGPRLIDSHGRAIADLRLSITDRCNFRCVYCLEPDVKFAAPAHLLTHAELVRVAAAACSLGVTSIRLTGGEPTVHPRLLSIISGAAALPIRDLSMTTNGSLVTPASAASWKKAGLRRLTFSLDSTDEAAFSAITRSTSSAASIINAIAVAADAGLTPIKVNAVVVRGRNETQLPALARLARSHNVQVRFIEYMPLDSARAWDTSKLVPASEIIASIHAVFPLEEVGRECASSTSLHFRFADGAAGSIGVIAPVTRPFCGACSRLRITADGKVRPCLFSRDEWDLRSLLREGASDAALAELMLDAVWSKQKGHGITSSGFVQPQRTMSAIGG